MASLPPDMMRQSPVSIGDPPAPGTPLQEVVGAGDAAAGAEPPAGRDSPRRPDYRLRGLDLDARHKIGGPSGPRRRDQLRRRHRRRFLVKVVLALVVVALVAGGLRATIIESVSVPSAAMMPTLHAGDRVLVMKSNALAGPIQTGNIVVFRQPAFLPCSPAAEGQDLVQRVIGLPGETIWSRGGSIYIDGRRLREAGWYDHGSGQLASTPIGRIRIPSGSYFVMDDHRADACDSRSFGTIPASSIVGKAEVVEMRNGHPYIHFL